MKHYFYSVFLTLTAILTSLAPLNAGVNIPGRSVLLNGTLYTSSTNVGGVPPNRLFLQGAGAATTQNGGDDVCTVFADYSVSGGGPSGTLTLGFISQTGSAPDWNKAFGLTGQSIDIAGLGNGTYTLTVNFRIFGRFGGVTCFGSTNPFNTGTLSTIAITFTVDSALPIHLSEFDVKRDGPANTLSWTTEQEINNAYFSIERSHDGTNWKEIAQVQSQNGNSLERLYYTYNDAAPLSGKNYYRLRQVDTDGQFSYSPVVVVDRKARIQTTITPNPVVGDAITVSIATEQEDEVLVRLFNAQGQLIHTQQVAPQSATNVRIDAAPLPAGMYLLQVGSEQPMRLVKK
jgi:Secretion system C-terminal sorting domain